jgi:hypothetical protein
VTGALQAIGGVGNPSAPQNYGVIAAGGPAECRTFTFIPSGACGSTVTATLHLQEGTTDYGNVTYTFTLGIPNNLYVENFDAVIPPTLPSAWSAGGDAPTWATSSVTPDTAPNKLFVDDPAFSTAKVVTLNPMPINSAISKMIFRNNYDLEAGFDGGVLEVSIDGGPYGDFVAAGGTFASGGYNSTINTAFGSPIAGRQAWSGNSGGYITTVANLGWAVGHTLGLRFRMVSDSAVAGTGWGLDTVSIQDGFLCAPVPLSAVSRKTHGAAGTFDLNLSLTGNPTVEPRSGGPNNNHQVVVTFAAPITMSGASISAGTATVSSFTTNGSDALINLTGVTNAQKLGITLDGVTDGNNAGCVNIPLAILLGDTSGNGTVNASDIGQTKSQSGQAVTASNFRIDVTANGAISASDISQVKTQSGTALPP